MAFLGWLWQTYHCYSGQIPPALFFKYCFDESVIHDFTIYWGDHRAAGLNRTCNNNSWGVSKLKERWPLVTCKCFQDCYNRSWNWASCSLWSQSETPSLEVSSLVSQGHLWYLKLYQKSEVLPKCFRRKAMFLF
jgi:hypothetical protein